MSPGLGSGRATGRQLTGAVAKWVLVAPFFVLMATALPIAATNWAFGTRSLALETLVAVVLMTATFAWLLVESTFGGTRWLLRFGRFGPTVRATALAFFAVVSFTCLTALLHDQGVVAVTPEPSRDHLFGDTATFYLWQLANTVPLVDITGNLQWHKPFEFDDRLGGCLVILFTGFVIFPLIQLARLILAGGDVSFDVSVQRALAKHLDRSRVGFPRHPQGYGRALVDRIVTIDVMSAVWNDDAALQRLERLRSRPAGRRPEGYLLVVDAIANAARERIELALSQAPFEASLVVWRPDQPEEELIAALDALENRIEAAHERIELASRSD